MARYKLDIQKRQHRERAQPLNRQRLGLLEKHKDYVKRARDYHSKQDRIKKLRQKAALKNPDEFYFEMINSSTEKGVHVKTRGNKALDNDFVQLLKSQDFGYVKTCRAIEEKKANKLKEQLGSMVNAMPVDADEDPTRQKILNLIHQGTSAVFSKTKHDDRSDSEDEGPRLPCRKKTFFVDSVDEVRNFTKEPPSARKLSVGRKNSTTNSTSATLSKNSIKSKGKTPSPEEKETELETSTSETEAHMKRLANNLQSRLARLRALQKAERELELKRALMGKGTKFLKHGASSKKKPLPNGRDLSWYDKLDRNDLIEEQEEKERLEKLNSGIKTGAKVWKWKAERKR